MPELKFKGKTIIRSHHLTLPYRQLKPVASKSRNKKPSLDDNLIIHGDNLLALKSLLPSFAGKIKCIYIDPPYNTGNEKWVYNDNVNSPMHQEWLKKTVDREDLTRHDKWLCMMWPRLVLLRDLLREDGVICISVDDNESARLVTILDEIFGEDNKEEIISWRRRHNQPNDKSKPIAKVAEFIVVYAKNLEYLKKQKTFFGLPLTGDFSNPDNDPKGDWASKPWKAGSGQTGTRYKIVTPSGKELDEEWLGTRETFDTYMNEGRIYFPKQGDGLPRKKYYRFEREEEGQVANNFWGYGDFGSNQEASEELNSIGLEFDNPKPVRLVKALLTIFTDAHDLILDSFAGSGTTGHAVLALNAEDEGNRKFILIEQEEYADNITAERMRRVMKGVPNAKDEKLKQGYGGTFSYFNLGPALNEDEMLGGKTLPSYLDLARYVFFTATGEQLDETHIKPDAFYLGESKNYRVWLYYQPDVGFLKNAPLNKTFAQETLGEWRAGDKTRLVIGSHKYLDDEFLREHKIEFCQLPFAIYRFRAS